MNTGTEILALLTGRGQPLARGEYSAIAKYPAEHSVKICYLGIFGDEQADLRVHGGPDKALHHYPFDHYPRCAANAPDGSILGIPGAFGENISTFGLCEDAVCIGDRFRMGTALIEVSQGRQPCWKQAERLKWNALPALMVKERRSGWYYRVIEEGTAQAGDALQLLARPLPDWTVARVFGLLVAGDYKHDLAALRPLVSMDVLFTGWRARAAELLSCG